MASFFEKLKKGMGIEEDKSSSSPFNKAREIEEDKEKEVKEVEEKEIEEVEEKEVKEKPKEKPKRVKIENKAKFEVKKIEKIEKEEVKKPSEEKVEEKWLEQEGQLAVDVYQTETDLVIQSAIAGVKPEDLDILIEKDILTIKGERRKPFEENGDYFSQECFWGRFSRQIILPVEIDPNKIEASLKEGILTIRTPKILREKKRKIVVKR